MCYALCDWCHLPGFDPLLGPGFSFYVRTPLCIVRIATRRACFSVGFGAPPEAFEGWTKSPFVSPRTKRCIKGISTVPSGVYTLRPSSGVNGISSPLHHVFSADRWHWCNRDIGFCVPGWLIRSPCDATYKRRDSILNASFPPPGCDIFKQRGGGSVTEFDG